MSKEKEAIYVGGHKVGYRAVRGNTQGFLYKKNGEEYFQPGMDFIKDMLSGPCIDLGQDDKKK